MDDILFQAPVEIGSLLFFNSQVTSCWYVILHFLDKFFKPSVQGGLYTGRVHTNKSFSRSSRPTQWTAYIDKRFSLYFFIEGRTSSKNYSKIIPRVHVVSQW